MSGKQSPNPGVRGNRSQTSEALLANLRRIIQAVDVHSKRIAKETGLTTAQFVALQACERLGEVTTKRLSTEISLSQGTVTAILDRLEAKALIERYRSLKDRRVVHARVTDAGRNTLVNAPGLLQEKFMESFAHMPEGEQAQMIEMLARIAEMMTGGEPAEVKEPAA